MDRLRRERILLVMLSGHVLRCLLSPLHRGSGAGGDTGVIPRGMHGPIPGSASLEDLKQERADITKLHRTVNRVLIPHKPFSDLMAPLQERSPSESYVKEGVRSVGRYSVLAAIGFDRGNWGAVPRD
jgi:hypothetical protein